MDGPFSDVRWTFFPHHWTFDGPIFRGLIFLCDIFTMAVFSVDHFSVDVFTVYSLNIERCFVIMTDRTPVRFNIV